MAKEFWAAELASFAENQEWGGASRELGRFTWPDTAIGRTSTVPCPAPLVGSVSRKCMEEGIFEEPVGRCNSDEAKATLTVEAAHAQVLAVADSFEVC